jgi:hypothetical protein
MSIYPEILAGYEAVRDLATTDRVTVKDPRNIGRVPSDPLEMMASFPTAYTVELVPLRDGINVCPWGRYGFPEGDMQLAVEPDPENEHIILIRIDPEATP